MKKSIQAIMDPSKNPLLRLSLALRFQIMLLLSVMWSLIFCAMAGIFVWYPTYVLAHVVLLSVGTLVTALVFRSASKQ
jgi:hypothetical protein